MASYSLARVSPESLVRPCRVVASVRLFFATADGTRVLLPTVFTGGIARIVFTIPGLGAIFSRCLLAAQRLRCAAAIFCRASLLNGCRCGADSFNRAPTAFLPEPLGRPGPAFAGEPVSVSRSRICVKSAISRFTSATMVVTSIDNDPPIGGSVFVRTARNAISIQANTSGENRLRRGRANVRRPDEETGEEICYIS